jgi:hypothetical protein
MQSLNRRLTLSSAALIAVFAASCNHLPWNRGEGEEDKAAATEQTTTASVQVDDPQSPEETLRAAVSRHVEAANAQAQQDQKPLIRRPPYFYRQFDVYPEGAAILRLVVQETESQTAPALADVELPKIRYATQFHRKREAALEDGDFIRDTGTETLTYELRNNEWHKVGSLFVAEKTEKQVDGHWVAVEAEIQRTAQSEEPEEGNWFARAWKVITGR